MPIYIFFVRGTGFFKLGYTAGCPWMRVVSGAWANVHPAECCNKLGFKDLELLALFEGSMQQEQALQALNPHPENGEFWPMSEMSAVIGILEATVVEQRAPLRPVLHGDWAANWRIEEKRACCERGCEFKCWLCEETFARYHQLVQHKNSAHSSTLGRAVCEKCGAKGLKRNIVQETHRLGEVSEDCGCKRHRFHRLTFGPQKE